MKRILSLLCLALLLLPLLSLVGCEEDAENGETITLYVYNWGEYISDGSDDSVDTNAEFEAYCRDVLGKNVKVNYSTFSSVEDMYAKVSSGSVRYDVIIPSDYIIQRMAEEGLLYPLAESEEELIEKIPNYADINEKFRGDNIYYGDGTDTIYSVPYFYGMVGVIYNLNMVDEEDVEDESWDLLWNEKYSGNILQFNNSRDAFGTALYRLGYSVNDATPEEWDEALESLKEQKKILQGYVMDEIFNKMEGENAAIAAYYAGDFLTMYEESYDEENDEGILGFYYPAEGTNYYVDAMCIPWNAKNPDLAMEYINFMCSEEIGVANAEYTYYASPLNSVIANEEYQECMAEVHEDAVEILYGEMAASALNNPNTEAYLNLDVEGLQALNERWRLLKGENTDIGVGVYVLCGVILASLVAWGVWNFIRKRHWQKLY